MPVLFKWNVKIGYFRTKKVKIGKIKNLRMENIGFGSKIQRGIKKRYSKNRFKQKRTW